jgi:hypothetical protein
MRAEPVKYRTIKELRHKKLLTDDLPFLKRSPFENEAEFRLLYISEEKMQTINIPIPLSCIERVTLSPWLPKKQSSTLKSLLRSIPECDQLGIVRSTLISNEIWKRKGESARGTAVAGLETRA